MKLDELRDALPASEWLAEAESRAKAEPDALPGLFARADRKLGREPIAGGWTAGQVGRAVLLRDQDPATIIEIYEHGDAAEKLAVLKALPLLNMGDAGVPLLLDALRTNDTRLVAAALGGYAEHLDAATWRQGVIKLVFMGVPLDAVADLDRRADAELAQMLRSLADERAAAGREMPADATALLEKLEA
ncbi:EboA domain-containing protein [Actinoplanes sp. NPDC049265]|uniref:EboA domain-containing protein n=1 Tax=Actinoplanes sp. NPDC049265 TaxID=3363902 RepID=UPI0037176398